MKKEKEDLLAARSLIYIKLLGKEELAPDPSRPTPHTDDELRACRLTAALMVEDCAALYPEIRRLSSGEALESVRRYLKGRRGSRRLPRNAEPRNSGSAPGCK